MSSKRYDEAKRALIRRNLDTCVADGETTPGLKH
jgi:hypothetical protein